MRFGFGVLLAPRHRAEADLGNLEVGAGQCPIFHRFSHPLPGTPPADPSMPFRPLRYNLAAPRYTCAVPNRANSLLATLLSSSPLREAPFRRFYIGSVGTALGYTTQTTIVAWLMTTLTPSAFMVALVQTASTAPSLLLGLFAGALADIADRRRVILVTQVILLLATMGLGAATLLGAMTPFALLAFTFVIGAGFTFYMPAQSASINDLVARADVPRAVALGAVAFNVSRAVGPALAGAAVAWLSSGSALLASGVLFIVMIVAMRGLVTPPRPIRAMPETIMSGIESGLRYARHSPRMRALILHNVSFALCASALLALLPVIARDQLSLGAGGFGFLSASFGIGAVVSALPGSARPPSDVAPDGGHGSSRCCGSSALCSSPPPATRRRRSLGAFATGASWTGVLSSLSAGTQTSAPAWVRARSVAMNLIAVQVSMALGSAFWGWLASLEGTRVAMLAARRHAAGPPVPQPARPR